MQTESGEQITAPLAAEILTTIRNGGTPKQKGQRQATAIKGIRSLAFLCLLLVLTADALFYGHTPGWTLGGYGILLILVVVYRWKTILSFPAGRVLLIASLGLALAMIAQPGPLVGTMGVVSILSLAMTGRIGWSGSVTAWWRRWSRFLATGWLQVFRDVHILMRRQKSNHGTTFLSGIKPKVTVWLLPVCCSLVFLWLFTLANPVLSMWMMAAQAFLNQFELEPARLLFWILIGALLWGLLRIPRKRFRTATAFVPTPVSHTSVLFSPSWLVRCLSLFNAVFAVQTILDLTYLWGGASLPDGISYASYAHRGAYPLIITALLAGIFVLITFRPGGLTREMGLARRLVYFWLAQNLFLVISAMWRLYLYVQVYSLTRWRVAAGIWMLLVAAGILWIGCRIFLAHTNAWLLSVNFVTTLFVLYACCFVNFEGLISWYNVRHCRDVSGAGVPIDLCYLRHLGPEALPALDWIGRKAPRVADCAQRHSSELAEELQTDLRDWRGWTLRRERLRKFVYASGLR